MSATVTTSTPLTQTRWAIDPAHTLVEFSVKHLMISRVKGRFAAVQGEVAFDRDDPASATIAVEIDASSIDTREEKRDEHLRSADFLETATFPTLTFQSRRIEPAGDDRFIVTGDLTLHGVTREVTLDARAEGGVTDPWGNEKLGFSATTTIDRRDFGLTWNAALETGGVLVGHDVRISIETELVKHVG